jgi:hypothetical protein
MAKRILDLCEEILGAPAPVVMLDACATLDIIRAPLRENVPPGVIVAARNLVVKATATPKTAWIVASQTVIGEWERHRAPVEKTVGDHLGQLDRNARLVQLVAADVLPSGAVSHAALRGLGLEAALVQTAQNLIDAAEVLGMDDHAELRAGRRVQFGRPPSSKGKSEYSDCLIFEHYLELSRRLEAGGFRHPRYLVTSNTRDYGSPTARDNSLLAELTPAGLRYVTDLWWLMNELG